MGLAYNRLRVVGSGMWSYGTGLRGDLFRLASGWMLSRQEMVRLINGFMSGPSTTAGTQQSSDSPLFFKSLKYWLRIRNPTNYPVRYKLYKCTLNHDDVGGTQSIYDEGTVSFNVGHNYLGGSLYSAQGNYPGSSFWKFWQQRDQFGAGAAARTGGPPYLPFLSDQMVVQNDGLDNLPLAPTGDTTVSTTGSLLNAHTCFEDMPAPADIGQTSLNRTAFLHRSEPLTRIFPSMRKQLTVRVVASGRLGAFQSKRHRFRHRMPRSVKPLAYLLNDTNSTYSGRTFMKGLSHFFVIRAYSPPPASLNVNPTTSNTFGTEWTCYSPQLAFDWTKTFECRIAGDTLPNQMVAYDYYDSTLGGGYMGRYQGGFRNGFHYVDSTGGAEAQETIPVDTLSASGGVFVAPPVHVPWDSSGTGVTPAAANPLYLN